MGKEFSGVTRLNDIVQKRPCARCKTPFRGDLAKCPSCGKWNVSPISESRKEGEDGTLLLTEVADLDETDRISLGAYDAAFGIGGLARTSVVLFGGAPGAGKSTASLQLANEISGKTCREVLYVGAEEAERDIKSRAQRLGCKNLNLIRVLPMSVEGDLAGIMTRRKPAAVFLDSLPGLVGDDLASAVALCKNLKSFAVALTCPIIVIDHVTKNDDFAGLMKLQHEVDTTMTLFPFEEDSDIRELTIVKNRFGAANRSIYFRMTDKGLFATSSPHEDTDGDNDDDE